MAGGQVPYDYEDKSNMSLLDRFIDLVSAGTGQMSKRYGRFMLTVMMKAMEQ